MHSPGQSAQQGLQNQVLHMGKLHTPACVRGPTLCNEMMDAGFIPGPSRDSRNAWSQLENSSDVALLAALQSHSRSIRRVSTVLSQDVNLLRRALGDCCRKAVHVVSYGVIQRRLHPCCAAVLSTPQRHRAEIGGDLLRLRHFIAKLQAGRPTTSVVLGSSVASTPFAGCTTPVVLSQGDQYCAFGFGWARMFVDFVGAVWPQSPHHVFSLGRTGASAASFVDCFQTHLGDLSVDLFLFEFAIVGDELSNGALEMLTRRCSSSAVPRPT